MKRVTAFIMALTLMVGLTACGGGEKGSASSKQPPTESQSQTASSFDKETQAFLDSITVDNAEFKGICGANAMWYYKDNVLVIKGTGRINDYEWYYNKDGYEDGDTSAPWGGNLKDRVHWVIIEDGITSIGEFAFCHMKEINKVSIPDSVTEIHEGAFLACVQLGSLTIPASVNTIEEAAFEAAFWEESGIEELVFEGAVPENIDFEELFCTVGKTIRYSDSSFEPYVQNYSAEYNWIKQ